MGQGIAEAAADSEALDRAPLGYFRDVLADAPQPRGRVTGPAGAGGW